MTAGLENSLQFIGDQGEILKKSGDVQELLAQTYWAKTRDIDTIERSIKNSICYAVLDKTKDKVIAFARTVTDFATMYYLCDVVVDEKYRGKGVGKKLVEWIMQSEAKNTEKYGLLLTRDAQKFYEQYGFSEFKETCMCINK